MKMGAYPLTPTVAGCTWGWRKKCGWLAARLAMLRALCQCTGDDYVKAHEEVLNTIPATPATLARTPVITQQAQQPQHMFQQQQPMPPMQQQVGAACCGSECAACCMHVYWDTHPHGGLWHCRVHPTHGSAATACPTP